jgi:hypothetical protein
LKQKENQEGHTYFLSLEKFLACSRHTENGMLSSPHLLFFCVAGRSLPFLARWGIPQKAWFSLFSLVL